MYEHRLNWYSNDGTGETVSLESETVTPDRFWGVCEEVVGSLFEPSEKEDAEVTRMTRDQFRLVVKALVASGQFSMGVPRVVANHEFHTGKGWSEKTV